MYLCSVKAIVEHIITQLSPFYGQDEARELAFWIIEETTGMNRFDVCTHKGTKNIPELDIILKKLCEFVPVQYIFGHTEWLGLDLKVTPATLIPRPETAELVELVCGKTADAGCQMQDAGCRMPAFRILDIGTGSGCIALGIKQRHPEWQVEGLDKSEEALEVARANAVRNKLDVRFHKADILTDDIAHYDLIVSNPPYVRPSEIPTMTANTLRHEPADALFVPENDALIFYRRIAELHRAGELWFEINEHLGSEVLTLMQLTGYEATCIKDIYGKQRFIHARFSR